MTVRRLHLSLCLLAALAALAGCEAEKPTVTPQPYVDQGYRHDLPPFMHGTVMERTDLGNTSLYPVTGYSLVVNLHDTGDNSNLPTAVRNALIKRMAFAGFGQHDDPRFTHMEPEEVLADKRVAVVQVIGLLPVGARQGQQFDVVVRAMPRSHTTSLAHGHLYSTELRNRGLELPASGGTILAYSDAGDVFVNPVYALDGVGKTYPGSSPAQVSASLLTGTIMNGGRVTEDRPIFLQLRIPQANICRRIEARINTRFPPQEMDRATAAAQDEGLIYLYVPLYYRSDWKHFSDLVNHLYLNDSPDYVARKVHQLMADAHKPQAALSDISLCLEGFGPSAVPMYESLINDPDPAVAYAAARAAVFCDDEGALDALTAMATDSHHPFQLAAVRTIGQLPPLPAVDKRLEPLLGCDQDLVRLEAYKILADHGDRRIVTQDVEGRFKLDIIDYDGPPLIFAFRTGEPRIALFGRSPTLVPPVTFAAMQDCLTVSTDEMGRMVNVFYRDPRKMHPVHVESSLDFAEVIARLGGVGPPDSPRLDFNYADVVAIVQGLSDSRLVVAGAANGQNASAPFVLDRPAELTDALVAAALQARPQGDEPTRRSAAEQSYANPSGGVPSFDGPSANDNSVPLNNTAPAGPAPSVPEFGSP